MYIIGFIGYSLGLILYRWMVILAALLCNVRANLFVIGRKNIFATISNSLKGDNREKIWFHCASLGEFEQAKPIIEKLKAEYSQYAIVITFFSPSGYEIRKNDRSVDYVFYLPLDSKNNALRFIELVKPKLTFFVKYEIWFHYLSALKERNLPIVLISANFRKNHIYFKWYGLFFKQMLLVFNHIFCQNEDSFLLLENNGIKNISVSKDTRFDRVWKHANQVKKIPVIEAFIEDKKVLVIGSSYAAEETIVNNSIEELADWKIIIAPHHIDENRIFQIEKTFGEANTIRFSDLEKRTLTNLPQIVIINNIGLLSSIYKYASAAFIGGGYGKTGLHNTLEAATFGMPILFGPNNLKKFPESIDLINAGVGFIIKDESDFMHKIKEWNNQPSVLLDISQKSKYFVSNQIGATQHIFAELQKQGLL